MEFLLGEISDAYSADTVPPLCPHCGAGDTRCASVSRERAPPPTNLPLPTLRESFTRLTCTPMAHMRRKDLLHGLGPLLSQRRPLAEVAEELGVSRQSLSRRVQRFREWLLILDPSGQYERRVRLGVEEA
ncbi:DNA-binding protein [Caballeronia choica]|uniref:DNA-binding protein n=1 Tax=Caballeronia choica TaxID=326476 RepID=A0A158KVX6_9BURK|nr:DNA-binding protein [Caballeronia choica]